MEYPGLVDACDASFDRPEYVLWKTGGTAIIHDQLQIPVTVNARTERVDG